MSKSKTDNLPATFDYTNLSGGEALRKYIAYAQELTREDYLQWYDDERITAAVVHVKSFCVLCILLAMHEFMMSKHDITVSDAIRIAVECAEDPVKDPLVRERIQQFSCMLIKRPKEGEETPTYVRREYNRICSRLRVGRMLLKWIGQQDNPDIEPWPAHEVPVGSYYAMSKGKDPCKMLTKALGDGAEAFAELNKPKGKSKKENGEDDIAMLQEVATRANTLIKAKKLVIVDKDNDIAEVGFRVVVNTDIRK
jgi:hypothetical protein